MHLFRLVHWGQPPQSPANGERRAASRRCESPHEEKEKMRKAHVPSPIDYAAQIGWERQTVAERNSWKKYNPLGRAKEADVGACKASRAEQVKEKEIPARGQC